MDYKVTDTQLSSIANAIRTKGGTSAPLAFPSAFISAINAIPTGGSSAVLGTKSIVENGVYSANADGFDGYSEVTVSVTTGITPSGEISIFANGTYDVASYASAVVSVPQGGGDAAGLDIAIAGASGSFYNSSFTSIRSFAFYYCQGLYEVSLPACEVIGSSAFMNCFSLTKASFPACKSIYNHAFSGCFILSDMYFPMCTFISASAFQNCSSLSNASFPECTIISQYAFSGCKSLTSISFPKCTQILSAAFQNCSHLTQVYFPLCSLVSYMAFSSCIRLSTISLPACTDIGNAAFMNCYNLLSLYLLGSSVVSLGTSTVFNNSPISNRTTSTGGAYGSIFVPASLYDTYISATNWSYFSARFVSLTNEEIAAL